MYIHSQSCNVMCHCRLNFSLFDKESKDEEMVIRCAGCSKAKLPARLTYGNACQKCYTMANKTKAIKTIVEWCERLDHIRLVHLSLGGHFDEQAQVTKEMGEAYEMVSEKSLGTMSYPDLLLLTRAKFQHIGYKYQNEALRKYLALHLDFLTKGLYLGVPMELRPTIQDVRCSYCIMMYNEH